MSNTTHRSEPSFHSVLPILSVVFVITTAVEIAGQGKKPPPPATTPGPPVSKTRLQVKDANSPIEHWTDSLTITASQLVTFRYFTSEPSVASAEWRVSDKPFSTGPNATAAQAPHVISSGNLSPSSGQLKSFDINFAQLPKPPDYTPLGYWVFVVTKNAQKQVIGQPSAAVKIVRYALLDLTAVEVSRDSATKVWHLKLTLNYLPPDAEIGVQRLKNDPFPDVWWAKDKWIAGSSSHVLRPKKTSWNPAQTDVALIEVDLPADVGAGNFHVRVLSKSPKQATRWQAFEIHYPPPPDGEIVLEYLGLESLEETDEVGADEILVLATENLTVFDGPTSIEKVNLMAYHTDVDKGEMHPATRTVYVSRFLRARATAVAVVEIDDGYPTAYANTLSNLISGVGPGAAELKSSIQGKAGAARLLPAMQFELKRIDEMVSNGDDLVAVVDLPLWDDAVPQCKQTPDGVRKDVIVQGDGGRFKLLFHLFARPRP